LRPAITISRALLELGVRLLVTIADTRECLLAALRCLRDHEHNFRSLERLWEAVAPDPGLYPHRYQYN
jgi:type I restriction enzyme, R subunit